MDAEWERVMSVRLAWHQYQEWVYKRRAFLMGSGKDPGPFPELVTKAAKDILSHEKDFC